MQDHQTPPLPAAANARDDAGSSGDDADPIEAPNDASAAAGDATGTGAAPMQLHKPGHVHQAGSVSARPGSLLNNVLALMAREVPSDGYDSGDGTCGASLVGVGGLPLTWRALARCRPRASSRSHHLRQVAQREVVRLCRQVLRPVQRQALCALRGRRAAMVHHVDAHVRTVYRDSGWPCRHATRLPGNGGNVCRLSPRAALSPGMW